MYRMTDQEFKSALREALEREEYPDGKLPPSFQPIFPVWYNSDHSINRVATLERGPYHFLTDEQRKKLLEEVHKDSEPISDIAP